jgi:2-polyprenyl-6-methoxyphenol hydroxylase-like FAD-dependent oxidoreductase
MLDWEPLPSWTADRVALLGDAVHPMPAYLAQGACQAIEDAAALADALADCPGPDAVAAALAGYQARRAPRATRVARARQVWEAGPLPRRPADAYEASDWLYAPSAQLPASEPAIFTHAFSPARLTRRASRCSAKPGTVLAVPQVRVVARWISACRTGSIEIGGRNGRHRS